VRRPIALLIAAAMAAAAIGCGGGGASEPTPTPSATGTSTPEPASTATPTITAEPAVAAPSPSPEVSRCPDPYPGGAPYEAGPGEQLRLRPRGSGSIIEPYAPRPFTTDPALERVVRRQLGDAAGHFSIVVKDLSDGRGVKIAPERSYYAASLFKTWVMLEVFHQRDGRALDASETYIVSDYYAAQSLNPGELQLCDEVAVPDVLSRMMSVSDNVAANLLLDRVGIGNLNATLSTLGLTGSGFPGGGAMPASAADMALLLESIARREALSGATSDEMLALLASEAIDDRLPATLPAGTPVAHKTGSWPTATHDVGIVYSPNATYVIAVLTDFGFQDPGADRIARLSRAVYDYYNPP
jgi:beta-lactamase class A